MQHVPHVSGCLRQLPVPGSLAAHRNRLGWEGWCAWVVGSGWWKLSPNRQLWQLRFYLLAFGLQMMREMPSTITNHFACCPISCLCYFILIFCYLVCTHINWRPRVVVVVTFCNFRLWKELWSEMQFDLSPELRLSFMFQQTRGRNGRKGEKYSQIGMWIEGSIENKYSEMVLFTHCICKGIICISAWTSHSQLHKSFSNENEPFCNLWNMISSRHEHTVHKSHSIIFAFYLFRNKDI